MKKISLSSFFILFLCSAMAQTTSGSWNSTSATYTKAKHSITWQLVDDLDWVGRPIIDGNTLCKVRNDELQLLVSLNAMYNDGPETDVWDMISMYDSDEYQKLPREEAKRNGMTYNGMKAIKSQLCGNHANKIKCDMSKYHSGYGITVHSVEYTYQFIKNHYIYTLAITILGSREEDLADYDRIVTMLFNGFSIK